MGSYSFKSVGKTKEQSTLETLVKSEQPIGVKTPLQLGTTEGILAMHYSLADQVHDNLRNLLLTNWGERLQQYYLGANLSPLLSDYATQDDFDSAAISRINAAVQKWMPYINLQDYLSEVDNTESRSIGVIRLTITYGIPSLQVEKRALQLTLKVL
jgi:phage baseplate assembly protein W